MPDGIQRLGERLWGWILELWEYTGLKLLIDRYKSRNQDWDAIASIADLQAWVRKYGGANSWEVSEKALELGASQEDILDIVDPGFAELRANPSLWLSDKLQDAFASPYWQELNEIFGASVFDPWLASLVSGQIPTDAPELENVRRFLGTQAAFESLGSIISTLVETASAGQIENAGRMFSDAKWLLGTCFTSWQSTSPIVGAVILDPLEKLVNRTFRQANFTRSQWMDLYALGKITPQRLGEELANLGYDDGKIQWLLDLAMKEPSRSDVLAMFREGIVSDGTLAESLRKQGYDQVWIDRFLRLYTKEETTEEKGAYIGTLRKAYKENLIGESELRDALKRQGRSDEAIDLEIAVLNLSTEVEVKTAAKSDIGAAYFANTIGRPEAENWLSQAGFPSHVIKLIVDTWDKERAPTYKTINKSEILQAWGVGLLTRPEAYQRLLNVGYPELDATILMDTYSKTHLATKPPEGRALTTTDIMWSWHVEVLEEPEALERLEGLGLLPEDAAIVFETFQRLHPRIEAEEPKELAKEDILDAYGLGVLNEETTFTKLLEIDYTETDADILMRSYELRPEALPPEPTISQLLSATKKGVIDQATLSQKLTVKGLKPEDVQFYVTYAVTPLPAKTKQLSRTDITKLWVQGRHDRAWALERLLGLNYSPEDAEDVLWLASPEIGDTETFILWSAGVIDDAIAEAMWFTMGFTEEQIAAVLVGE